MLSLYLLLVNTNDERQKVTYIYESYYSYMSYTAGKYLKSKQDIADTVHNSMLKIIENINAIDLSDETKSKNLYGIIAKNKAIDILRDKENKTLPLEDYSDSEFDELSIPESIVIDSQTIDIIVKAIDSMNDIYKNVCRLKYINELKEREIAVLLDLPPKTVNMRIFREKNSFVTFWSMNNNVDKKLFDSLLKISFHKQAEKEFEADPAKNELDVLYPIGKKERRFAKRKNKELKYRKPLFAVYTIRILIALLIVAAVAFCVALLNPDIRALIKEKTSGHLATVDENYIPEDSIKIIEIKYQKPLYAVYIKRTVILLLTAMTVIFCAAMLDKGLRETFYDRMFGLFQEEKEMPEENSATLDLSDGDDYTLKNLKIGYMPDQFNIIEEYRDDRYISNSYMTDDGRSATIEVIAASVGQISTDAVYHSYEQIEIAGKPAYKSFHTEFEQGKIIMRTENATVIIDAAVSENELIKIAENIVF